MNFIIIFLCLINLLIVVSPKQLSKFDNFDRNEFGSEDEQEFGWPDMRYDFNPKQDLKDDDYVPEDDTTDLMPKTKIIEGDIILDQKLTRSGLRNMNMRWPNGRVPYEISNDFDQRARKIFVRAFNHYHLRTCIRFVPRKQSDQSYIFIKPSSGCASYVGMTGRKQEVDININACSFGSVVHELMHALGFHHEQSRTDRDKFIYIVWENLDETAANNFRKYTEKEVEFFGQAYDYNSILHYSRAAFSKNGEPTIIARNGAHIGQRKGLSKIDVIEINKMYKCKGRRG